MPKTIIIGIGNEFRGDDAAGLVIARRLRSAVGESALILEHNGEGASLMEVWRGYDMVILLDAVKTSAEPGQIFTFDASSESLPTKLFHYSTHAFSIAEAVEMARALSRLPERVFVYGVQGKSFDAGASLSDEVESAVDKIVLLVLDHLNLLSSH